MFEFSGYYGKHKHKNTCLAQNNVAQNKDYILRARVDEKLYRKVKSYGVKEGELIRNLLNQYFNQIEIEGI